MIKIAEEKFAYKPAVKNHDAVPMWFCFPATHMIGMCSPWISSPIQAF